MRAQRLPVLTLLVTLGCEPYGALPAGLSATLEGTGPRVLFNLEARPLPEIPFPNDLATLPDPTSPTGRRLNLSLIGPTLLESGVRAKADRLDGFGTFSPISVRFDAPIDPNALRALHLDRDPKNDAVLVVDVDPKSPEFGRVAPLDLGYYAELPEAMKVSPSQRSPRTGRFPSILDRPDQYFDHDPRGGTSTLLFDTLEETDDDGDGELDLAEDTDGDGHRDVANTDDGRAYEPHSLDEVDHLLPFYERETNTLLIRTVMPLREGTTYAVVLTRRVVDEAGEPVRSPFDFVNHTRQTEALRPIETTLSKYELTLDDVAFAWSFTTQSSTHELLAIRDGINGQGPLSFLAEKFPPKFELLPWYDDASLEACRRAGNGPRCEPRFGQPGVLDAERLQAILTVAVPLVAGDSPDSKALIDSYNFVSHVFTMELDTPNFLIDRDGVAIDGYPQDDDESFETDLAAGTAVVGLGKATLWCTVPRTEMRRADGTTVTHKQPFPVVFYGHGYGGARLEMMGFAGHHARFGLATCGLDAYGHGTVIPPEFAPLIQTLLPPLLQSSGLDGTLALTAVTKGRARDLNNDGIPDSGGDFWTADTFHTRDMIRQSAVDQLQMVRLLRTFDGKGGAAGGDFDGDGVADLGGPKADLFSWGQSLGGILSVIAPVVERQFVAAAPTAGGAGLVDIGIRSSNAGVPQAVVLRMKGPMILGDPIFEGEPSTFTGRWSINWLVPNTSPAGSVPSTERVFVAEVALEEGDVFVVRNLSREARTELGPAEFRAAYVRAGQGFRTQYAADAWSASEKRAALGFDPRSPGFTPYRMSEAEVLASGDHFVFEVYRPGAGAAVGVSLGEPVKVIDQFQADTPFQGTVYPMGAPLVAPSLGLGHRRQTPDLRRFFGIAQAILDAGDPAQYARHYFLDPLDLRYQGVGARNETRGLVVSSTGDQNVPINAGISLARAMGVVDFEKPREDLHGLTEDDFLLAVGAYEGAKQYPRWQDEEGPYNFDVDDLDDGTDDLVREPKANFKLRLTKSTPQGGLSALRMPYTARNEHDSRGGNGDTHGFDASTPSRPFDINTFMAQQISRFFQRRGAGLTAEELDAPCLKYLGDRVESCPDLPVF